MEIIYSEQKKLTKKKMCVFLKKIPWKIIQNNIYINPTLNQPTPNPQPLT